MMVLPFLGLAASGTAIEVEPGVHSVIAGWAPHHLGHVFWTHRVDVSHGHRCAHQLDQVGPHRSPFLGRDAVARCARVAAVPEQHLGAEDVAHPGGDLLVHQQRCDGLRRPLDAGKAPVGVGVAAASELGQAEAKRGRPVEALLSAYRVGASAAWRELSVEAVAAGVDAATLGRFAELVFTYIDELSAASVAGHNQQTSSAERERLVQLDRLTRGLLTGLPELALDEAVAAAGWVPPRTLTAVLVERDRVLTTAGSAEMSVRRLTTLCSVPIPLLLPLLVDEVLLGTGDAALRVRLNVEDRHLRPGGTVSGPSMMALADYALYAAILANIGPVALAVTTSLSFNFLRKPGAHGLVAECRLLKLGRRLAVGEVAITAVGSPDLVCHATGTYSIPPR